MVFRLLVAVILVALGSAVGTLPASAQQAEGAKWPTTEFEVSTKLPGWIEPMGNEFYNMLDQVDLTKAQAKAIEDAMQEIAEYFQAQGFRPPELKRGFWNKKYVVRVLDMDRKRGGARYEDCILEIFDPEIVIEFNSGGRPMFKGQNADLSRYHYELLAHELFHAIQLNYPGFQEFDCSWGGWLFEGTAEAVGHHVAEVLTGKRVSKDDYWDHLFQRPYDLQLHVERDFKLFRSVADPNEYATASFWWWLAEQYKAGDRLAPIKDPGVKGRDFRYLHEFFKIKAEDADDTLFFDDPTDAEIMTWLDVALRMHFTSTLPRAYADFVTSYADYIPDRVKSPAASAASWRKGVFGGCAQATLSRTSPVDHVSLRFNPVAARCVEVDLDTQDKVELVVIGRGLGPSPSKKALAGMSVGVPGTSQIRQADLFALGDPEQPGAMPPDRFGKYEGHDVMAVWRVCFDPQVDEAIIIANASGAGGEELHAGDVEFAISHADWYASLTNVGPQMKEAALVRDCDGKLKKSFAARAEDGSATDAEKAQDKVRSDLASVSTHTMAAATVGRSPDEPSCGYPFKWRACGPMTRVSLRLMPGTFGDLSATSGRGGFLAQMTGMLQASGQAVLDGGYGRWADQVTQIPGYEVRLHFPLIDYGYTGSFSNAYITAQMPDRKVLESIGPTDAIPGQGTRFPLNGQVTITEYSPEIMRGSFSGTMVYREDHDPASGNEQQTLPVRHELKGDFVVAAPIVNDRRTRQLPPHEYQDLRADLELIFPGLQGLLKNGMPRDAVSTLPDRAAGMSSQAQTASLCDCSCNFSASASPVCKAQCEPVYRACQGQPAKVEAPEFSPAEERAAILELRQAVLERSIERFGDKGAAAVMIQFDAMPQTLKAKRFWAYMTFPELKP